MGISRFSHGGTLVRRKETEPYATPDILDEKRRNRMSMLQEIDTLTGCGVVVSPSVTVFFPDRAVEPLPELTFTV